MPDRKFPTMIYRDEHDRMTTRRQLADVAAVTPSEHGFAKRACGHRTRRPDGTVLPRHHD